MSTTNRDQYFLLKSHLWKTVITWGSIWNARDWDWPKKRTNNHVSLDVFFIVVPEGQIILVVPLWGFVLARGQNESSGVPEQQPYKHSFRIWPFIILLRPLIQYWARQFFSSGVIRWWYKISLLNISTCAIQYCVFHI